MKSLMEMPGMQRHVDYYARNDEILRLGKELGEELTDENKEHVVSLECAWGQRIFSKSSLNARKSNVKRHTF